MLNCSTKCRAIRARAVGAQAAMFNGKPRAGNSREIPVSRETGGKFSDLGNSPYLGKFPGNFPYLGNFPRYGKFPSHGKFPKLGKFPRYGNFPGIPVQEIPGREKFEAIREGGNGNFPLNIPAGKLNDLISWVSSSLKSCTLRARIIQQTTYHVCQNMIC